MDTAFGNFDVGSTREWRRYFFFAQVSFIIREKKRKRCNTVSTVKEIDFLFLFFADIIDSQVLEGS